MMYCIALGLSAETCSRLYCWDTAGALIQVVIMQLFSKTHFLRAANLSGPDVVLLSCCSSERQSSSQLLPKPEHIGNTHDSQNLYLFDKAPLQRLQDIQAKVLQVAGVFSVVKYVCKLCKLRWEGTGLRPNGGLCCIWYGCVYAQVGKRPK